MVSVEILLFSLDPDCVFAEGYIIMNTVFLGL